jgi:hypothetical protein
MKKKIIITIFGCFIIAAAFYGGRLQALHKVGAVLVAIDSGGCIVLDTDSKETLGHYPSVDGHCGGVALRNWRIENWRLADWRLANWRIAITLD